MTLVIHSDHDHLCATSTSVYQIYTAIFVVKKMHSDIFTNTNTSKWIKTNKHHLCYKTRAAAMPVVYMVLSLTHCEIEHEPPGECNTINLL